MLKNSNLHDSNIYLAIQTKKSTDGPDPIDVNNPVTNHDLKLAFQTFNTNKSEQTLLGVISEIKKANLLILLDRQGIKTANVSEDGMTSIEEGSMLKFFKTFDENGNAFIPAFTDWKEIDLWVESKKNIFSWVMKSNEAFEFVLRSNVVGVVINPCSDKWNMNKEQINNFLKEVQHYRRQ